VPVVYRGQSVNLHPRRMCDPGGPVWKSKAYCGGRTRVYGEKNIKRMEKEIAAIREHYGVNASVAIKIAIHLTANAISTNKATPEIEND
jgi:hypothetical protein